MSEYKNLKKIGIWMDHSHAHLIEYGDNIKETDNIILRTSNNDKGKQNADQNESMIHNKEQQDQAKYYKKLSDKLLDFDIVLLFGPTDAKTELLQILKDDHHFDQIKIDIKPADKMTENQKHAFVKLYYLGYRFEE